MRTMALPIRLIHGLAIPPGCVKSARFAHPERRAALRSTA
jgi:hypothetical protein